MAFCTKCGNRNEDESRFCSYCGAPMYQAQQTEPGYGSTLDQERYGGRQPYEERAPYERRPGRERRLEPGDKLKWHHYLVYFGLWASAVVNVVTGLSYFSGSIYEGEGANAELVYFVFGNELKALDMHLQFRIGGFCCHHLPAPDEIPRGRACYALYSEHCKYGRRDSLYCSGSGNHGRSLGIWSLKRQCCWGPDWACN